MTVDLDLPRRTRWQTRLCARLGGLCALLRIAHDSRVPF